MKGNIFIVVAAICEVVFERKAIMYLSIDCMNQRTICNYIFSFRAISEIAHCENKTLCNMTVLCPICTKDFSCQKNAESTDEFGRGQQ